MGEGRSGCNFSSTLCRPRALGAVDLGRGARLEDVDTNDFDGLVLKLELHPRRVDARKLLVDLELHVRFRRGFVGDTDGHREQDGLLVEEDVRLFRRDGFEGRRVLAHHHVGWKHNRHVQVATMRRSPIRMRRNRR